MYAPPPPRCVVGGQEDSRKQGDHQERTGAGEQALQRKEDDVSLESKNQPRDPGLEQSVSCCSQNFVKKPNVIRLAAFCGELGPVFQMFSDLLFVV